jgi:benzoyl-CoA reductase/2-hydroxyglutaryl-CoA dehydratase subunit BcrC/BadD/HgdB
MLARTALSVDEKLLPVYSDVKELESIRKLYQLNASVWDRWAKHINNGGKVVGTLANSPIELLRAAEVFSVIYKRREELNRAIVHGSYELRKFVYQFGVGECICRYVSGGAGSPIHGACPGYDLVITDFLPKAEEWNEMIKAIGSKWDFDFIELPERLTIKEREEAIYNRLLNLKCRLEKLTGKKISDEKLRDSIRITNKVTEVFNRIDALIKANPHPLKSFDIYNLKVICTDYIGGQVKELLGICYLLEDELKERVEAGIGYEGTSVLLAGGFRNEFLHAINKSGGIVTAAWPYQRFTAHRKAIKETGEPLEALARWYASHSGFGIPEEDARDFADLVKHYEVGAIIYNRQCPFGTKAVYTSHDAIKEAVEKLGIPFLTIEAEEENPEKLITEFLRK